MKVNDEVTRKRVRWGTITDTGRWGEWRNATSTNYDVVRWYLETYELPFDITPDLMEVLMERVGELRQANRLGGTVVMRRGVVYPECKCIQVMAQGEQALEQVASTVEELVREVVAASVLVNIALLHPSLKRGD